MIADSGKSGEWKVNSEWKREDDDLAEAEEARGREDFGRSSRRMMVVRMRARSRTRRIGRIATDVLPRRL
jgi:hypothetical protein